ncbi:MAG: hypothetical protein ACI9F9_001720 [Candidatus Paceibacteria bacterium]|jgi:hypothetical protein
MQIQNPPSDSLLAGKTTVKPSLTSSGLRLALKTALVCSLGAGLASAGNLDSLTTTFLSDNGQAGNMFDVKALEELHIVALDGNFDPGTISVEVYTTPGTYIGNETNSNAWTLVASGQVVSIGTDMPTPLPFVLDITIPIGQSMGFYVTAANGSYINYTNGLGTLPATAAANADMEIGEGLGVAYPFSSNYSPRVWNGTIYYVADTGTAYCFGDLSASVCPCGNLGQESAGCANSGGQGAKLVGAGSLSLSQDNLTLQVSDLPPNRPGLLVAGTTDVNGGGGAYFGDGFLCSGGSITNLGLQYSNATGDIIWGPGLASSGGFSAGATQYFQVIYRDTYPNNPCGTYFNASNGVRVNFQP